MYCLALACIASAALARSLASCRTGASAKLFRMGHNPRAQVGAFFCIWRIFAHFGFISWELERLRERFWERLSLGELNKREWEALCDGCGQCCLLREVEPNAVTVFGVACELLDIEAARCRDYARRLEKVPSCHRLTPANVPRYDWLPKTCAYRLLHHGKPLPSWHPLLVGGRDKMRKKGITVSHYALPCEEVPRRHLKRHVVERWPLVPRASQKK